MVYRLPSIRVSPVYGWVSVVASLFDVVQFVRVANVPADVVDPIRRLAKAGVWAIVRGKYLTLCSVHQVEWIAMP